MVDHLINRAWELMAVVEHDTALSPNGRDWVWVMSHEDAVSLLSSLNLFPYDDPTSLFDIPIIRARQWSHLTLAYDMGNRFSYPSPWPYHPGDKALTLANGEVPVWRWISGRTVPDVINPLQLIKAGTRQM